MKRSSVFQYFSSVRFAIPALFLFAAGMIYGTIQESLHGADYAGRAVYQSWWFYLSQGLIALSVFLAMLSRLPFKPRLLGFYIVHIGLLTIMAGSIATKFYGIDGSIELNTHEKRTSARLNLDRLYVRHGEKYESFPLPNPAGAVELNRPETLSGGQKIRLLSYFPFAQEASVWAPRTGGWASSWQLQNDRVTQKLLIGNELGGALDHSQELGPLHVEVVEEALARALSTTSNRSGFLLLDSADGKSYPLPDLSREFHFRAGSEAVSLKQAINPRVNISFFKLQWGKQTFVFMPRFSPYPITDHMQVDPSARFRLFSLEGRGKQATVFISPTAEHGIHLLYGKGDQWQEKLFQNPGEEIALPLMGFKMRLLEEHRDQFREISYEPGIPQKDEEQSMKVLRLELDSGNRLDHIWVTNRAESNFSPESSLAFSLGNSETDLPFSLQLERFKMDMIPGTESPATYESFVKVQNIASGALSEAHIYMNNPLKSAGYTFYQSSYLQDEKGEYHSILSVNRDPGRPIKYAGALLLVFGLVLHFLIIHRKIKLG